MRPLVRTLNHAYRLALVAIVAAWLGLVGGVPEFVPAASGNATAPPSAPRTAEARAPGQRTAAGQTAEHGDAQLAPAPAREGGDPDLDALPAAKALQGPASPPVHLPCGGHRTWTRRQAASARPRAPPSLT